MTALLHNKQKSSSQLQKMPTQVKTRGIALSNLYVKFKQSDNLQRMRDCLSFTSYDFETIDESFKKTNTACRPILADCLDILKSAMCTIAQASRFSSVDYNYAKGVFEMAVLAAQTTVDCCLKNMGPLDAHTKQELDDIYQSLNLATRSLVH